MIVYCAWNTNWLTFWCFEFTFKCRLNMRIELTNEKLKTTQQVKCLEQSDSFLANSQEFDLHFESFERCSQLEFGSYIFWLVFLLLYHLYYWWFAAQTNMTKYIDIEISSWLVSTAWILEKLSYCYAPSTRFLSKNSINYNVYDLFCV